MKGTIKDEMAFKGVRIQQALVAKRISNFPLEWDIWR